MLVAAEVALSLMLLIGAALLTRSFVELSRVEPGFDPSQSLTLNVGVPVAGRFNFAADAPRWARIMDAVTAQVAQAPGVVAAGAVSSLPLTGIYESGGVRVPGRQYEPGRGPSAQYNVVSGDYFRAAGIRLIAGRTFDASDADSGRATIIVNDLFAKEHFGTPENAIGREVNAQFELVRNRPPRVVVGVVGATKQISLDQEPLPQVYVPVAQYGYPGLRYVVRTSGDPLAVVGQVKQAVRAAEPTARINDVQTFESVVAHSLARQRFSMTLIGTFAIVALVLAIVGLYSVLALLVGQRQREIGVRLALGAAPGDVVRMVVGEGARVTAAGLLLGIGGAYLLTRVLESFLYGVGTRDPLTFTVAALLVALAALAGSYAPARRASRVDPKAALTSE
jgi:predicted permease